MVILLCYKFSMLSERVVARAYLFAWAVFTVALTVAGGPEKAMTCAHSSNHLLNWDGDIAESLSNYLETACFASDTYFLPICAFCKRYIDLETSRHCV